MSRRVDQIELVRVSIFRGVMQPDAFRFDGDAALALQIHRVQHLLVHFALRKRAGHLQQPVRERGLAVIDVRDDAKIAYELRVHSGLLPPAGFSCWVIDGGPSLRGRAATRRSKPCRVNIQFATNRNSSQPVRRFTRAQPFVR